MSDLKHPAELNPFLQFRQANSLSKKTSRAKNLAWYQEALDHDFQLHLRTDGASVSAFLYDRRENLWAHGPALTEAQLLDPAAMVAFASEGAKHARANGGKSLGVILHIADEFALTEIKHEFNDRSMLPELRKAAIDEPASILADTSINPADSSWRLLPYFAPASESIATAVTISRRYDHVLTAIRNFGETSDFPVITHALSAPLIALLGIPAAIKPTPGRSSVAILQYPFFTALAFFNEDSDLLVVRTQLHRGLRRPPNFRHAVATTNASLELVDPDIFVFPYGKDVDATLVADLAVTFTRSRVELATPRQPGSIPHWCAECLIATRVPEEDDYIPGNTFPSLRDERWSFQDFLPPAKAIAEIYPTRSEMRLLRGLRYARVAALLVGLLAIAWLVSGMFEIRGTPEWAFDPSSTDSIKQRLVMLNKEKQKTEHWDSLLADRSKAWVAMESLSRLFPENSGTLVKNFSYTARPETSPGQAKAGFIKEWKITGLVKDEALEMLNALNTREGIAAHFGEIAQVTGNDAFRTDIGTRSLVVNIRTQENSNYKPAGVVNDDLSNRPDSDSYFPFTFDLSITQRFEATDPLAIIAAKAP